MIFFSVLWRCQLLFSLVGKEEDGEEGRGSEEDFRGWERREGEGRWRGVAAEIHAAHWAKKKTCLLGFNAAHCHR